MSKLIAGNLDEGANFSALALCQKNNYEYKSPGLMSRVLGFLNPFKSFSVSSPSKRMNEKMKIPSMKKSAMKSPGVKKDGEEKEVKTKKAMKKMKKLKKPSKK